VFLAADYWSYLIAKINKVSPNHLRQDSSLITYNHLFNNYYLEVMIAVILCWTDPETPYPLSSNLMQYFICVL
jgi:hypothetical protein